MQGNVVMHLQAYLGSTAFFLIRICNSLRQLDCPKEDYDQLSDKIQTQDALECASYVCQVQSKNDILDLPSFFETGFFFQTWLLHLLQHRQHLTGDNLITR